MTDHDRAPDNGAAEVAPAPDHHPPEHAERRTWTVPRRIWRFRTSTILMVLGFLATAVLRGYFISQEPPQVTGVPEQVPTTTSAPPAPVTTTRPPTTTPATTTPGGTSVTEPGTTTTTTPPLIVLPPGIVPSGVELPPGVVVESTETTVTGESTSGPATTTP